MAQSDRVKLLFKILIGAAWIDGQIQPEEREYLYRLAKAAGLADDAEIQLLLYEFRTVEPKECYEFIRQYLGDRPTAESYQRLIDEVVTLVGSDGKVAMEEARLLTKIKLLDPATASEQASISTLFKAVQELYQRWLGDRD